MGGSRGLPDLFWCVVGVVVEVEWWGVCGCGVWGAAASRCLVQIPIEILNQACRCVALAVPRTGCSSHQLLCRSLLPTSDNSNITGAGEESKKFIITIIIGRSLIGDFAQFSSSCELESVHARSTVQYSTVPCKLTTMSVTPWTELEVELFGTAGSFANPKPYMSIREALMQETHRREQAVRGEATARAVADGELTDRVVSMISRSRVEAENACKDAALTVALRTVKDAQEKQTRLVAEAEARCMKALQEALQWEAGERQAAAKQGDQSSFLRLAAIVLFFSVCFAGLLYGQEAGRGQEAAYAEPAILAAPAPVKDVAMQHAITAHDVRLVKVESDRQAFVQRLNRAEVELAAAQAAVLQHAGRLMDLGGERSDMVHAALQEAMQGQQALADSRAAEQQAALSRAEADVKGVKDQLAKVQFVIPTVQAGVARLEGDFRRTLELGARLDAFDGLAAQQGLRMEGFEHIIERAEFMKKGFRAGDYQVLVNADGLMCVNGYSLVAGRCLMLSELKKPFQEARQHCLLAGGDLAVVRADADWGSYSPLVEGGTRVWLGLQKPREGGEWEWVDGTRGERGGAGARYQRWGAKQPDGSGRCAAAFPVVVSGSEGEAVAPFSMEAADCAQALHYICQSAGTIGFEKVANLKDANA
jgi:hypothetical protein